MPKRKPIVFISDFESLLQKGDFESARTRLEDVDKKKLRRYLCCPRLGKLSLWLKYNSPGGEDFFTDLKIIFSDQYTTDNLFSFILPPKSMNIEAIRLIEKSIAANKKGSNESCQNPLPSERLSLGQ